MRIAGSIVSSLLTSLIIFLIFSPTCGNLTGKLRLRSEKDDEKAAGQRLVRLDSAISRGYYIVVTIFAVMSLFCCIFPQVSEALGLQYWILVVIAWGLTLFCLLLTAYVCRKVVYGDGMFTYINAFGVRKTFSVHEIKGVAVGNVFGMKKYPSVVALLKPITGNVKLYTGKGSIVLFRAMAGLPAFLQFLSEENAFPDSEPSKNP